jgi:hypothetical protein
MFFFPFFVLFSTQEGNPRILRFSFVLQYTVIILAAPQETVGEAGMAEFFIIGEMFAVRTKCSLSCKL